MNNSSRTRWAAKGLLIASFLVVIFAGAMAFKGKKAVYDPAESEAKLRKIGAALQLYRAEFGYKPVAERNNYSDAGLPPSLPWLIQSGHPWSLEWSDFQISDPRNVGFLPKSHFSSQYWDEGRYVRYGDLSPWFKSRGEQLIVLTDANYAPRDTSQQFKQLLVLRLNGTVEVVSYDKKGGPLDILRR